ncbi:MAG: hypothetical protein CVV27_01005 [Candidatus Melainabacteria bacterium HGW-Melainabacteria-1]|nr:MAG: hypothetical protein CVV27_01005 [Candidatus Melainabacteria bacterium HGW-Melainabacteria-1]
MMLKRYMAFWFTGAFLAACTLAPQPTTNQAGLLQGATVEPAIFQPKNPNQSSSRQQPEKITFASMVKTTELSEPKAEKHQQLNEALKQLLAQDGPQGGYQVSSAQGPQVEIVRFMTKANNPKNQIKVNETDIFKLVIEANSSSNHKLEISDADATDDGIARLRLPSGNFEALLHLQGPWQSSSALSIEDSLYYLKDILSSKTGKLVDPNRWYTLGIRPLPVPEDWHSPDGQTLILEFNTKDVKEFQLALWRENEPAPFPPGVNRIGTNGGILELPGVGTFKVAPNALNQDTTMVMRQVLEIPPPTSPYYSLDGISEQLDYISPVVKIEPVSQTLQGIGEISLKTDLTRLGNNSAGILNYMLASDPFEVKDWERIPTERPQSDEEYDNYPTDLPGGALRLGYFTRVIPSNISPNDGTITIPPSSQEFRIQADYSAVLAKHGYRHNPCRIPSSKIDKETTVKIQDYCNSIFGYYTELMDKAGAVNYPALNFYEGFDSLLKVDKAYLEFKIDNENRTVLSQNGVGNSLVKINSQYDSQFDRLSSYAEAAAHELWHVFQNAAFKGGNFGDQIKVFGGNKEWQYEGAAQYMGASTMKGIPFSASPKYYAYDYIKSTNKGVGALGLLPFYEFSSSSPGLRDYRSSAFFTYLSHPSTYSSGDKIMAKIAAHFSNSKPTGERGDIQGLSTVISNEFNSNTNAKNLKDHFFKFSHFGVSKERLDLFPKDKVVTSGLPSPLRTFTLLPLNTPESEVPWIVGHKQFKPFKITEAAKSLSAKYYAFNINNRNRSNKRFAIKVKLNTSNTDKLRASALFYRNIDKSPVGVLSIDKYALEPDARLGSNVMGMPVFNASKGFVLTEDFNDKYESIFLVVSAVDYDDREIRNFDIEVSMQAKGNVSTRQVRLVEPDGPPQVAGGGTPDIYEVDQRAKMVVQVPGCDPNNCMMLFEHRQEPIQIAVQVPPEYIKTLGEDEFGIPIQEVAGIIPNDAKPGGRVTVMSDGIVVDTVDNTPEACWMLDASADYSTSSQKPCVKQ